MPREQDGHASQPKIVNPRPTLNPEVSFLSSAHLNYLCGRYAKGAILLQTARVRVYNPDKHDQLMEFRAILDTGSQQSNATQGVKDSLAVQSEEKSRISIMTFGASETQEYEVIKIGVMTEDGRIREMELFTVPLVCQPL